MTEPKEKYYTLDNLMEQHKLSLPWYEKAWDFVYLPIYRFFRWGIWEHIYPGKLKHYYQRARYGYSYQDCWSIDYHLSDIIPKMIQEMRNNLHGCPGELHEKYGEKGHLYWDAILQTIQVAFQIENDILNDIILDITDKEARKNMEDIMKSNPRVWEKSHLITEDEQLNKEEGWKNFQKYFINLWD